MLRFYTGSSEVFVLVLLDAVATNQPHCGASNGDHYVQLPTDDFVKHFGVCQQIMQRRMSLRGDLPHSVVDVLLEPSLDWLIEASLPLPDASWQSAGILQLPGSLAVALDFPSYGCLIPLKRRKPASDISTQLPPA